MREGDETIGNITESLGAIGGTVRQLVADILELAATETRSAGIAIVAILAFGFGSLFSLIVAWFMIWAAIGAWFIESGMGLQWVCLLLALANILIAGALVLLILRFSRRLTFSATRRALSLTPTGVPKTGIP